MRTNDVTGRHREAAPSRAHSSPWETRFLAGMERRDRPPPPRQRAVLERIASGSAADWPNFATVNSAVRARPEDVCRRLLRGGRRDARRWRCGDLAGSAGASLSVVLHGDGAGRWADFATGQGNGAPVSLVAAIMGDSPTEAARKLARMLGLQMGRGVQ
jgi:hypothetical protein